MQWDRSGDRIGPAVGVGHNHFSGRANRCLGEGCPRGQGYVENVPLQDKGDYRKDHADDGRGDQDQQAELNDAEAVEGGV